MKDVIGWTIAIAWFGFMAVVFAFIAMAFVSDMLIEWRALKTDPVGYVRFLAREWRVPLRRFFHVAGISFFTAGLARPPSGQLVGYWLLFGLLTGVAYFVGFNEYGNSLEERKNKSKSL